MRLGGRYVLRAFAGAGGMGQVWRAFDQVLDKEVALKRVRSDVIAEAEALESLRREVLLAQTVTHINVCRIYDLEQIDGDWVIKMEIVGGRSLSDILQETPSLPLERALFIARQLARALAAVHAVGVIHRDLKPQNILVDDDGRAVVMDFGIARTSAPTGDTAALKVVGTPEYMAPEQARGDHIDARADLYALGCVLYRMIAGEVPFPATTRIAAMARHLTDPPPDARTKRPEVPPWLAQLARDLMAKSPAQRPPDALTVAARLGGPPPRLPRVIRVAAASVLVLVAAGASLYGWRQHHRASWTPQLLELPSQFDAETRSFDISPDNRTIAYDGLRDGRFRLFVAPIAGGTPRAISEPGFERPIFTDGGSALLATGPAGLVRIGIADGSVQPIVNRFMDVADCGRFGVVYVESHAQAPRWSITRRHDDGSTEELLRTDAFSYVACDARGQLVYRLFGHGQVSIHLATLTLPSGWSQPRKLFDADPLSGEFALTRAGTLLMAMRNRSHPTQTTLWEMSLDGKQRHQLALGDPVGSFVQSPDGTQLYYDTQHEVISVHERERSSGRERQLTFGSESVDDARLTDDGRTLVLLVEREGGSSIVAHPLTDEPERVLATLSRAQLIAVDGDTVYVESYDPDRRRRILRGLALADGRARIQRPMGDVGPWSVRGGRMTYAHENGVWRSAVDGSGAEPLAPGVAQVDEAPRGGWRVVRFTANRCSLLAPDVALGGTATASFDCVDLRWSPDGGSLYYQSRADGVHRYDIASRHDERVLGVRESAAGESPDGRFLYFLRHRVNVRRHVMLNFGDRPPL